MYIAVPSVNKVFIIIIIIIIFCMTYISKLKICLMVNTFTQALLDNIN